MGMFNNIRCLAPLPQIDEDGKPIPDFSTQDFQTKDIEPDALDLYEIRADGTLWIEEYDIEDHSDPNAEGIARIFGNMTRVNKRWTQVSDYTGLIHFYDCIGAGCSGWIEFKAHFGLGRLLKPVELVTYRPLNPDEEAKREAELKAWFEESRTPEGPHE